MMKKEMMTAFTRKRVNTRMFTSGCGDFISRMQKAVSAAANSRVKPIICGFIQPRCGSRSKT